MASKFVFVSLLSVAWAVSLFKLEQEPQCYSRFDYEYKVVQKLVDLDSKQNEQKEDNAATQEMIKASEAELSTFKEKLHTLEAAEKEHDETVSEMKAELEEVKSQNENLVTEIENLKEKTVETKVQAIAFSAAADSLDLSGNQPIVFNYVILNVGGGYDASSGKFTCPQSGIYMLTFFIGHRHPNTYYTLIASLVANDAEIVTAQVEGHTTAQDLQGGNAVVVKLNKDDKVWVKQHKGSKLGSYTGRASSFSGVLLYSSD